MREYPDLKLSSAYPIFSGKKLSQIADEIEKSTYQGQEFQQELIEQTIAYIIEISLDYENIMFIPNGRNDSIS